ncbi:hypothetical protein [Streptomyces sp. NPDC015130]|uniref:hypothetical protein n=1 Tax=Streptomyces sp. NPDC015130 TaxID=3364940 RepID=UPI003700D216
MTPGRRLSIVRAQLDTPPPATVPGQLAIPAAALAVLEAAEQDATNLHEDDHARAERAALYLASSGWTITPAR